MPIVAADNRKRRAAIVTEHVFDPMDVDMPFSAAEVAGVTGEAYVAALGPSDMPVVGHWGNPFLSPVRPWLSATKETLQAGSERSLRERSFLRPSPALKH
jgi:hypothetical protein